MARVVKDADVRRRELLGTALRLFARVGYESTSVGQITSEVGVAKGTFYHYFSSKQDLLEQLVETWVVELFEGVEAQLDQLDGDAVERFRAWLALTTEWKLRDAEASIAFARSLYIDENLRLRAALWSKWSKRISADLGAIIAQGVREGLFAVGDAEATAAVVTAMWLGWAESHADMIAALPDEPETIGRTAAELGAMETAMERILGVPEGVLAIGMGDYVKRVVETSAWSEATTAKGAPDAGDTRPGARP